MSARLCSKNNSAIACATYPDERCCVSNESSKSSNSGVLLARSVKHASTFGVFSLYFWSLKMTRDMSVRNCSNRDRSRFFLAMAYRSRASPTVIRDPSGSDCTFTTVQIGIPYRWVMGWYHCILKTADPVKLEDCTSSSVPSLS